MYVGRPPKVYKWPIHTSDSIKEKVLKSILNCLGKLGVIRHYHHPLRPHSGDTNSVLDARSGSLDLPHITEALIHKELAPAYRLSSNVFFVPGGDADLYRIRQEALNHLEP